MSWTRYLKRTVPPVVAAHGLTLEEVAYPPDDELAGRAGAARRMRSLEDPA